MGILHFESAHMTVKEAQEMLDDDQTYFDYVKGRVMKIDLSGNELRTALYNRDNGVEAAEEILKNLLAKE